MTAYDDASMARTDALTDLHTRSVDTLAGYAKMVEKAEPGFRPVAEDFRALHARHADALARMLASEGVTPDDDGSLMGTINATVISVRSVFDDIDADLLTAIHNGEAHVLKAFDDVLAQLLEPADAHEVTAMRDALRALLAAHPAVN